MSDASLVAADTTMNSDTTDQRVEQVDKEVMSNGHGGEQQPTTLATTSSCRNNSDSDPDSDGYSDSGSESGSDDQSDDTKVVSGGGGGGGGGGGLVFVIRMRILDESKAASPSVPQAAFYNQHKALNYAVLVLKAFCNNHYDDYLYYGPGRGEDVKGWRYTARDPKTGVRLACVDVYGVCLMDGVEAGQEQEMNMDTGDADMDEVNMDGEECEWKTEGGDPVQEMEQDDREENRKLQLLDGNDTDDDEVDSAFAIEEEMKVLSLGLMLD